jgi:hypothetical protein
MVLDLERYSFFVCARRNQTFILLDFICFEHYFYENLINSSEDNDYETKDNYHCRQIQLRQNHAS